MTAQTGHGAVTFDSVVNAPNVDDPAGFALTFPAKKVVVTSHKGWFRSQFPYGCRDESILNEDGDVRFHMEVIFRKKF